jgi:TolB-like protein/DNA-binding winged helix-turn-helix (wHTH) protein/Tfp pilus assembly protein PilF
MDPVDAPSVADNVDYRVDDLLIDVGRLRVTRGETEIPLSGLSFELLLTLVRHAPRVLPLKELMDRVWPGLVVGPETVSQRIRLLREALGDDPHTPRYIAGVRGRGYRLVAHVTVLPTAQVISSAALASDSVEAAPNAPTVPHPARRLWLTAAIVVLACGTAVALWQWRVRPAASAKPTSVAVSAPPHTVAILPFVNLSGDPANDYFSDGLTEELINRAAQIPELRVTARTSVFAYKGKQHDVRAIGVALGAGAILEGGVRRSGKRVRVSAQLINAQDGYETWSALYDRDIEDIFAIQEDIVSRITQVVGIRLVAESPRRPTANPEAYDLYLKGRIAIAQRISDAQVQQAIALFERAIDLDPAFARAQAALAGALMALPAYSEVAPQAALHERAVLLARSALALDPTISDAHSVLSAYYAEITHDLPAAEAACQTAVRYGPNNVDSRSYYGNFLLQMGRVGEATRELSEARRLDPASAVANMFLSLAYVYRRDADRAERYAIAARQLGRLNVQLILGDIAVLRGQFDRALDEYRAFKLPAGVPPFTEDSIALIREPSEPTEEQVRTWVRYCRQEIKGSGACYWHLVRARQYATAFATARRQFADRQWNPMELWDPSLASARSQPGFKALVRDLGLVDYWRKYGWADFCKPTGTDFQCE